MCDDECRQRIRSSPEPWHDLPVIALTADAMSGDHERYLAEGMDCCISKPTDRLDLLIEIQKPLGVETAPGVSRRADEWRKYVA